MIKYYYSLLGICTNFIHNKYEVLEMLDFHDNEILKIIPYQLFIIHTYQNNLIAHHYYYCNNYLFSSGGKLINNSWKFSSQKIKLIDIYNKYLSFSKTRFIYGTKQ